MKKSRGREGLPWMAAGKEINVMYPSVLLFDLPKNGCLQPWGDNQYVNTYSFNLIRSN